MKGFCSEEIAHQQHLWIIEVVVTLEQPKWIRSQSVSLIKAPYDQPYCVSDCEIKNRVFKCFVQRVLYLVIFRACAHQTSAMAATVRLATRLDVPLINALVYELAEVEEMRSSCKSTDIGLNELLFTHAPFQGPTVFILEIEEPTKEAASQNKDDEAMSGTVVTKPLSDTSGEIEKVPPVNTSEVLLGNTASVELMLFRSVSNVKYRGRFFSEACSPKASDGVFLNEVSSPKSLLQSNKETDMEEPVLEVFRSASNMNLKEHDTSAPAIAASEVVEAPRGIPRINSGSEDLYAEVIGDFRRAVW